MQKLYSDYIFHESGKILNNYGLILNDSGKILEIHAENSFDKKEYQYYPGLISPGFINSHCHLELSNMKGKIDTGIGLIPFITSVVKFRNEEEETIQAAIKKADIDMYNNGIVAVGDISNKTDSIKTKIESKIKYYNFIEAFDFMQNHLSDNFYNEYLNVYNKFESLQKSFVPHASYSVSPSLFNKINNLNTKQNILSIHNQEIKDENDLFQNKSGGFPNFFESFGFSFKDFEAISKSAIHYPISQLQHEGNILFVHNTFSNAEDFSLAMNWNKNSYFVTCPNANLFIENRLPDYSVWKSISNHTCIGTDSLSSNWSLNILEEIKTILKYQSSIPLEEVLSWATINGAKALQMQNSLGTLSIGKNPGINWIQGIYMNLQGKLALTQDAIVKKIF
jgi:cytosine/adenosine deaminase-related metal-dependent hydrolase